MTALVGVYGASGCGRTVMPFLRETIEPDDETAFIDDAPKQAVVNGYPVLTWAGFLDCLQEVKQVCVAIANSRVRAALADKCLAAGVEWRTCLSSRALVLDAGSIGAGAIVSPYATIGANAVIGRGLLADLYSCVNHDCVLGDFVTLAPYANCNGNVVVGDHVYIGSGALIRQGEPGKPLVIGRGAVIGMGAVVTRDVPEGTTVVGNPARPLRKG